MFKLTFPRRKAWNENTYYKDLIANIGYWRLHTELLTRYIWFQTIPIRNMLIPNENYN